MHCPIPSCSIPKLSFQYCWMASLSSWSSSSTSSTSAPAFTISSTHSTTSRSISVFSIKSAQASVATESEKTMSSTKSWHMSFGSCAFVVWYSCAFTVLSARATRRNIDARIIILSKLCSQSKKVKI